MGIFPLWFGAWSYTLVTSLLKYFLGLFLVDLFGLGFTLSLGFAHVNQGLTLWKRGFVLVLGFILWSQGFPLFGEEEELRKREEASNQGFGGITLIQGLWLIFWYLGFISCVVIFCGIGNHSRVSWLSQKPNQGFLWFEGIPNQGFYSWLHLLEEAWLRHWYIFIFGWLVLWQGHNILK